MKKAFITLMAVLVFCSSSAAKDKILIIQSYHPGLAWTAQCEKGINEIIGSKYEITSFYMDTKRIPEEDFKKKLKRHGKNILKSNLFLS